MPTRAQDSKQLHSEALKITLGIPWHSCPTRYKRAFLVCVQAQNRISFSEIKVYRIKLRSSTHDKKPELDSTIPMGSGPFMAEKAHLCASSAAGAVAGLSRTPCSMTLSVLGFDAIEMRSIELVGAVHPLLIRPRIGHLGS